MASYTESALARRQSIDVVSDEAYQFSRSLRGIPSPGNQTHRASVNSWYRGLRMTRTVGTGIGVFGEAVYRRADGLLTDDPIDSPTVKIIQPDGSFDYRPISDFHRSRPSSRQTATALSPAVAQAKRDFELMLAAGQTQDYENDN